MRGLLLRLISLHHLRLLLRRLGLHRCNLCLIFCDVSSLVSDLFSHCLELISLSEAIFVDLDIVFLAELACIDSVKWNRLACFRTYIKLVKGQWDTFVGADYCHIVRYPGCNFCKERLCFVFRHIGLVAKCHDCDHSLRNILFATQYRLQQVVRNANVVFGMLGRPNHPDDAFIFVGLRFQTGVPVGNPEGPGHPRVKKSWAVDKLNRVVLVLESRAHIELCCHGFDASFCKERRLCTMCTHNLVHKGTFTFSNWPNDDELPCVLLR